MPWAVSVALSTSRHCVGNSQPMDSSAYSAARETACASAMKAPSRSGVSSHRPATAAEPSKVLTSPSVSQPPADSRAPAPSACATSTPTALLTPRTTAPLVRFIHRSARLAPSNCPMRAALVRPRGIESCRRARSSDARLLSLIAGVGLARLWT
eukprot:scaffold19186_cov117-Isochrysis_galbana.AAC.4